MAHTISLPQEAKNLTAAMVGCIELEGEKSFQNWYHGISNLPIDKRSKRVSAHLDELKRNARNIKVDHLVGDGGGYYG